MRLNCWSLTAVALCSCSGTIYSAPGTAAGGASSGGQTSGRSAGSGSGAASGSTTGGAPDIGDAGFEPTTVAASVSKVKNLLTGLASTDAEVSAVAADPLALRTLIANWISTPQYQQKMLGFFGNAFQQNASALTDFYAQEPYNQFAGDNGATKSLMLANYHEMFARTALELIAEGRPFTETYSTTRFMVTPALAGGMASLDAYLIDDQGHYTNQNQAKYPGFSMYLTTKEGPLPSAVSLDPHSSHYLHFYTPSLPGEQPPICQQDPQPYLINANSNFEQEFFGMFLGLGFQMGNIGSTSLLPIAGTDGGVACPVADTSNLTYADFEHWRMVNIRQPAPGELTTPYFDFDTIRGGSELVFDVPRVGFFSTPSFLGIWGTNSSNQFRVTMNQTMIVATNQAFDGTDGTAPQSLAAVDQTHAADTACFACHQQLDPMRQFFRHDYSLYFHQQTARTPDNLVAPQFAWGGVAGQGSSIYDLGRLLAQQPHVAATWVQNLCQWANSAPCDENDPEFQRQASLFQRSNFNWNQLIVELFSSPLVTYATPTRSALAHGESFGITRQAHLCALLSNRLGLADACGLEPATRVPSALRAVQIIAGSYPSDAFSRGQVGPVLANDPSLFLRTGLENICAAVANQIIDTGRNYSSSQPEAAIQDFVHNLMGLTADRAAPLRTLLEAHFAEAGKQPGIKAGDALKSTFVLACLSPYVAGLGQ